MLGIAVASVLVLAACSWGGGAGASSDQPRERDVRAVQEFDAYPLYWLGRRFEQWELYHVDVGGPAASFTYGTCEIDDPDGPFGLEGGSCSPPLNIQIQPLCAHLDVVARTPTWKRRGVRGAPVGTSDGAPVLFTNRVQVKVYAGDGADHGAPMRALKALRSANDVRPVLGADDPIPAPPPGVLAGTRSCLQ